MTNFRKTLFSIIFISIFLLGSANAQENSIKQIKTLDWTSESFEDLSFLENQLKDVQVVMLGEQSHLDGATFDAKIRLIHFLHKKMGFDILAFEGEPYGLEIANQNIKNGADKREELAERLIGMWSEADMFNDLIALLEENPSIEIQGFDSQVGTEDFSNKAALRLQKELENHNIKVTDNFSSGLAELFYNLSEYDVNALIQNGKLAENYQASYDEMKKAINQLPNKSRQYWQRLLLNIEASIQMAIHDANKDIPRSMAMRDMQMADNLLYLVEQFPNRKIICWGASYHFANDLKSMEFSKVTLEKYKEFSPDFEEKDTTVLIHTRDSKPMGSYIKDELGKKVYSIAFTAFEGEVENYDGIHKLPTPPDNSLERKFHAQGYDFAFTHLADVKSEEPMYSSILGYAPMMNHWEKAFDGVFYTKNMYPSMSAEEGDEVVKHVIDKKTESKISIEGKITDAHTGKPIEFVNMGIMNTTIGTYSNMEGRFELKVSASKKEKILQVSAIGYETVSLPLDSLGRIAQPLNIKLKPTSKILEEVVVSAKPINAKTILMKARKSIGDNYYSHAFSMDVFHRSKASRNDTVQYKLESLINVYDEDGLQRTPWQKAVKTTKAKLLQVRHTPENINKKIVMDDAWLIWGHDPVFTTSNLLDPLRVGNYDLTLNGSQPYGNTYVYEIAFKCKKPNSFNTGYSSAYAGSFEGTIFIDRETYAIVEFKAIIGENQKNKPDDDRSYNGEGSSTLEYKYQPIGGKYFLSYARITKNYKITHQNGELLRQGISFDEVMIKNINYQKPEVLKTPILKIKSNVPYRPEFWDNYNLILDEE